MRYKLLGKSGLRVSEICLGAMTFGKNWGSMLPGASKEEAKKIFDLFVSKGGNFIDTANVYQNGTSDNHVGEFVSAEREKFVLLQNTPSQQIQMILMQVETIVRIWLSLVSYLSELVFAIDVHKYYGTNIIDILDGLPTNYTNHLL